MSPRSDAASAIRHREAEERVAFVVRVWGAGASFVEVSMDLDYQAGRLHVVDVQGMGAGAVVTAQAKGPMGETFFAFFARSA